MKKLTAGIFASLLTVVAIGAARAEIASKAYVDDQLEAKVDATDIGTVTSGNMGASASATTVVAGIKEANDKATANAAAIVTLNGDATEDGSVANIATGIVNDIVGEVAEGKTVVEMIDAAGYDDTELSGAVDALTEKVDDETTGLAATKEIADANKTAIETLNGDANTAGSVTKTVNDAVDGVTTKIGDVTAANMGASEGTTTVVAGIKEANDAIAVLNGDAETAGSVTKTVNDAVDGVTTKIGDVTAANMGASEGTSTVVAAVKQANDTAKAAIPAPTEACADAANKCVLVSAGAGNYSWEVIARGTTSQQAE